MARKGNWIEKYLEYTQYSEAPRHLHYWTAVSTLAAAVNRRVWIDELYFQWTPNFYIIFVADPGIATKSTTIGVAENMLSNLKNITLGPHSLTWQSLPDAFRDAERAIKTREGELFKMSCITCFASELGIFFNPQDKDMVNWLTDLWDGKQGSGKRRTRKDQETSYECPWLNILAATTPSWIRDNVPESMIGGGLTSRIIFVFADKKRERVAYPSRAALRSANDLTRHKALYKELLDELMEISTYFGPVTLTEKAYEWGDHWYNHLEDNRPIDMSVERFKGYFARKQAHVHKLAIILSIAEGSDLIITDKILQRAEKIITGTEHDLRYVFDNIGVQSAASTVKEVANIIATFKKLDKTRLWQICMQTMAYKDFEDALEALRQAEMISTKSNGTKIFIVWKKEEGV